MWKQNHSKPIEKSIFDLEVDKKKSAFYPKREGTAEEKHHDPSSMRVPSCERCSSSSLNDTSISTAPVPQQSHCTMPSAHPIEISLTGKIPLVLFPFSDREVEKAWGLQHHVKETSWRVVLVSFADLLEDRCCQLAKMVCQSLVDGHILKWDVNFLIMRHGVQGGRECSGLDGMVFWVDDTMNNCIWSTLLEFLRSRAGFPVSMLLLESWVLAASSLKLMSSTLAGSTWEENISTKYHHLLVLQLHVLREL